MAGTDTSQSEHVDTTATEPPFGPGWDVDPSRLWAPTAPTSPSDTPRRSIADILAPIDAAVARHATVVADGIDLPEVSVPPAPRTPPPATAPGASAPPVPTPEVPPASPAAPRADVPPAPPAPTLPPVPVVPVPVTPAPVVAVPVAESPIPAPVFEPAATDIVLSDSPDSSAAPAPPPTVVEPSPIEPTPIEPTPIELALADGGMPDTAVPERAAPIESPSGRDWDAEIERSAGLAPLIQRGFGERRVEDLIDDEPSTRALADLVAAANATAVLPAGDAVGAAEGPGPWGGRVADSSTPDPWRDTSDQPVVPDAYAVLEEIAAAGPHLADDSEADAPAAEQPSVPAASDVTSGAPAPTDPSPTVTPANGGDGPVHTDTSATGGVFVPDLASIVPSSNVTGQVAQLQAAAKGAVTGEFIDLLEVSDFAPENDPMAVPIRPAAAPVVDVSPGRGAPAAPGGRRRRRRAAPGPSTPSRARGLLRSTVRMFVVTCLIAGLVVGGYFAVDRFVLAKRWPVSLQPAAQFIEERTGLTFERAIPVREVPREEFAAVVADVRLGLPLAATDGTVSDVMAPYRALGLWSGPFDVERAARVTARAWPAVYDPETHTVYVDGDVNDGDRRKAIVARELTIGLFDQHFALDDGARSPAEEFAYRTRAEAEAFRVASGWLAELSGRPVSPDEAPPALRMPEVDEADWAAVPDAQEVSVRVPLTAGVATATGSVVALDGFEGTDIELLLGVSRRFEAPEMPATSERDVVATGIGPHGTMGATFWLTVLTTRLDPAEALEAMSAYRSDVTRTVLSDSDGDEVADRVCVDAVIRAPNPAGAEALGTTFQRWAAMGPPQGDNIATVRGRTVAVRACDPGVQATTGTRSSAAGDVLLITAARAAEVNGER